MKNRSTENFPIKCATLTSKGEHLPPWFVDRTDNKHKLNDECTNRCIVNRFSYFRLYSVHVYDKITIFTIIISLILKSNKFKYKLSQSVFAKKPTKKPDKKDYNVIETGINIS